MKNKRLFSGVLTAVICVSLSGGALVSTATSLETDGRVTVIPSEKTEPLDPENPLKPVDPGESQSTQGSLRIDFVSAVNFADAKISKENRQYNALAQLFHNETPARGNYIQISDLREGSPGWSLQLKQTTQFRNKDGIELTGAVLSFNNGWANSGGTGQVPTMFRDTISINSISSAYLVASAAKGAGNGTWLLSFGASDTNKNNQEVTLLPFKDGNGKELIDPQFNKPLVLNKAISLSVPEKTPILAGEYGTELTWLLQATP